MTATVESRASSATSSPVKACAKPAMVSELQRRNHNRQLTDGQEGEQGEEDSRFAQHAPYDCAEVSERVITRRRRRTDLQNADFSRVQRKGLGDTAHVQKVILVMHQPMPSKVGAHAQVKDSQELGPDERRGAGEDHKAASPVDDRFLGRRRVCDPVPVRTLCMPRKVIASQRTPAQWLGGCRCRR
jgi:hypothetical protein